MAKSLEPTSLHPTIIHLNIQGFNPKSKQSKRQYLSDMAFYHNSFIIAFTETHLNSHIDHTEVNMNNWNLFRSDQTSRSHGGVCLYVCDHYLVTHEFRFSILGLYSFKVFSTLDSIAFLLFSSWFARYSLDFLMILYISCV